MADTQRSHSDLLALLADNTIGAIGAQDFRDVLESSRLSTGGCYISSSGATSIATVSTWTLLAGATSDLGAQNRFTHATPGRLTYTGAPDIEADVIWTISGTAAASAKAFEFGIWKNGGIVAGSPRGLYVVTLAQTIAISGAFRVSLSENDYLELAVQNTTDDTDFTATLGTLMARGHLV